MSLTIFGMVLPWVLVAVGCWLVFQLIRQNGRILMRLEMLQGQIEGLEAPPADQPPAPPPGLPLGQPAPEFELPDLAGQPHTLAEYRGKQLLLLFFNPQCGFCMQMADDLAALPVDGADVRPLPLVVSTGDAEQNRQLVAEHKIRCPVLLQKAMEVAAQFKVSGTPIGYLIDEQGNIASAQAVGSVALLALATAPAAGMDGHEANGSAPGGNGQAPAKGKANRGLQASRIKRDGLNAGTPAPGFRLPRLDGGELSLEDYRGRHVLLVFSDPECGPCEELARRLQGMSMERPDLQVVMVSRLDPEVNRQKIAHLGLTYPVVLQKQWEVSRRYAMFATPIGYLIDERGVIAADVAVGVESILALVAGEAQQREEVAVTAQA